MDQTYAKLLWEAQKQTTFRIRGKEVARIPFGKEPKRFRASTPSCGDCGARRGMYHGPQCDLEICPGCKGQRLTCGCPEETRAGN